MTPDYMVIREIIEKHDNIKSLSESLGENEESTIEKLKGFIKFSKTGKIVLNQNNNFCKIDELSNEKNWKNSSEKLKKIALYLDYDVRNELVNKSMGNPCLKDMSYKDICNKIDEKMFNKFKDISNHQNENYKNAAKYLSEYFDEIGEEKAEKYFRSTFSIKETIAYNVIYDEKTRKNFSDLEKVFGINNLSELSKNSNIQNAVKILINNDELAKNVIELEKIFDNETISFMLDNPNLINKISNDLEKKNHYLEFEEKFGKDAISKILDSSDKGKLLSGLINDEELFNNFAKYNTLIYVINRISKKLSKDNF